MFKKKFVKFFFLFLILLSIIAYVYFNFFKNYKSKLIEKESDSLINNSNIIKNVEYITIDKNGNEYLIKAEKGEIDFSNPNIIFLTKVYTLIKLTDSNEITIFSDFGKYNSTNYDTIFSKNVIINYLDNKITGEYLDFSLERNSMIISKDVIYTNMKNILKAEVIEMNIKTKDTKIFMHEKKKKVNIRNKN